MDVANIVGVDNLRSVRGAARNSSCDAQRGSASSAPAATPTKRSVFAWYFYRGEDQNALLYFHSLSFMYTPDRGPSSSMTRGHTATPQSTMQQTTSKQESAETWTGKLRLARLQDNSRRDAASCEEDCDDPDFGRLERVCWALHSCVRDRRKMAEVYKTSPAFQGGTECI